MIKFFRHIRQNLLAEGKTDTSEANWSKQKTAFPAGRYLKYAIGEIVLVVIGILIALQINNWNEHQKSVKKGREILVDIRENLKSNTVQFQEDIGVTKEVINSIDIVLHNITVTKIYNDSLGKHLRRVTYWETSRWKSSGYKAIISNGVEIIDSKELQEAIINLYEITYPEIAEYTRLSEGNFPAILPKWLELVERESADLEYFEHTSRPFDYQELIDSRMFRSILTFIRSQRLVDIELRKRAIEKNQELIELIDTVLLK